MAEGELGAVEDVTTNPFDVNEDTFWAFTDPSDIQGRGPRRAADAAAAAEQRALQERGRQFDVTQAQYEPWRQAGLRGLGEYERRLGQYGDFQVPSNIPGAYRSGMDLPTSRFQSGDYTAGTGNVPEKFQFGEEEFQKYRDPGYDFRSGEELKRLDRGLAAKGKRRSGLRPRALMELGQDLESEEFSASRGRAYQDYSQKVAREQQRYGRGVDRYGRQTGREAELYGRERNRFGEARGREAALDERGYRDYGTRVAREAGQYGRGLEDYARLYVDPMSRYGAMAGVGRATATGLGQLRGDYAANVGQGYRNIGAYGAAGRMGQAQAQAGAFRTGANIMGQIWGDNRDTAGDLTQWAETT